MGDIWASAFIEDVYLIMAKISSIKRLVFSYTAAALKNAATDTSAAQPIPG